jgi:hypothetical protein
MDTRQFLLNAAVFLFFTFICTMVLLRLSPIESLYDSSMAARPTLLAAVLKRPPPQGYYKWVVFDAVDKALVDELHGAGFRVISHHSFSYHDASGVVDGQTRVRDNLCGCVERLARTQRLDIAGQLAIGVDAFDVRCSRLSDGRIVVDHGVVFGDLETLLGEMKAALDTYPADKRPRPNIHFSISSYAAPGLEMRNIHGMCDRILGTHTAVMYDDNMWHDVGFLSHAKYIESDDANKVSAFITNLPDNEFFVQALVTPTTGQLIEFITLRALAAAGLVAALMVAASPKNRQHVLQLREARTDVTERSTEGRDWVVKNGRPMIKKGRRMVETGRRTMGRGLTKVHDWVVERDGRMMKERDGWLDRARSGRAD